MNLRIHHYAVAVVLTIGVSGTLWQLSQVHQTPTAPTTANADAPQAPIPSAQLNAFAILRGPSEHMPHRLRVHIREMAGTEIAGSLQLGNAQLMHIKNSRIWLIPGKHFACIAQSGQGSLACASAPNFVRHGVVLGIFEPPKEPEQRLKQFAVLGIAPDWAKYARMKVGRNPIRNVSVSENVYALNANSPIQVQALEP